MTHAAARTAAAALTELAPPRASFASDNTAGAHPQVLDAIVAANVGHAPGYGGDRWTVALEARVAELFGRPVTVAMCFGGTGANVVALHAICTPDSRILCTADAHIALDEAGAPERITRARLVTWPGVEGKLTPEAVKDAAAALAPTATDAGAASAAHVVSVTQVTEVGTVYTPAELAAVCDAAHDAGMVVHLDGARLPNALVAWGYGPDRIADACRALADTGVDVVAFGGTKAGLLGAEAVVFCNQSVASHVVVRRKQATQTSSKMRFLSAQFLTGLADGALLAWAGHANAAARRLADALDGAPGVSVRRAVDANILFVAVPPAAAAALAGWTPYYMWDPAAYVLRFVASWDTTDDDVDRLAAGIRAASAAGLTNDEGAQPGDAIGEAREAGVR